MLTPDTVLRLVVTRDIRSPDVVRRCVSEVARIAGRAGRFQYYDAHVARAKSRKGRFLPEVLERLGEIMEGKVLSINFRRSRSPYANLDFHFNWAEPSLVLYETDEDYYADPGQGKERIDALLETAVSWARMIRPHFGTIHQLDDWATISPAIPGLDYGDERFIPSIYWATYFGPSLVSRFGLERILKAPGWRAYQVSEEGVWLVVSPSPVNPESKESRERQMALMDYLGIRQELRHVYWEARRLQQEEDRALSKAAGETVESLGYDVTGVTWLE